jgi:cellulose synthase/poly-beta-1,6-N-acetylglucosamine synthase-like glycosyltransferase
LALRNGGRPRGPDGSRFRTDVGDSAGASGGVSVSASILAGIIHGFPLGAIPILLVVAVLVYLGFRRFRRWALGPPPTVVPAGAGAGGVAPSPPTGTTAEIPPYLEELEVTPPARPVLWTPAGGESPMAGYRPPTAAAGRPPAPSGFGAKWIGVFAGVSVFLLLIHRYIFFGLDLIVRGVGAAFFFPHPWPGLIVRPTLARTLPDYILLIYLAMMTAFLWAGRVFSDPRFARHVRWTVVQIVAGYVATEVFVDVLAFVFPERILASAFLLIRAILGGGFLALLVFQILIYPPPVRVVPRFPRDRRSLVRLAVTVLAAVAVGTFTLIELYRYVGVGRTVLPFAVLLLLPFVALCLWGIFGRLLYEADLFARPRPSLSDWHPTVSIVIPAYNEELNIVQAIESADSAAELYPGDTEIVVGNDGSTDRTSVRARAALANLRHARGTLVELPHGGKSNALNGALAAAQGVIIVRVDADSRLSTVRGFGALIPHLADPEVGGVQGLILPLSTRGWTRKLRLMEIAWNHLFLRRAMMATRTTQVVDGAFCAFRRADLVRVGGWVAWNGEDTELTLRLQREGYRMRFEESSASFEDVPEDLNGLRKQRIRWNRGGLFAHRRHLGGLFGRAFEFGGPPILLWFAFFLRSGLRGLVWVAALLVSVIVGLPTLLDVAVIAAVLLVPRALIIGYYLVKFARWDTLPYLAAWPVTGAIKQFFSLEAMGSMLPGSLAEFSE